MHVIGDMIKRFWKWYQTKLTHAIAFLFITHILQIPHMVWAGDIYLGTGLIAYVHPVYDFILYGIDLIEIPQIVNVTLLFIASVKKGRNGREGAREYNDI